LAVQFLFFFFIGPTMTDTPLLEVEQMSIAFGGLKAVENFSLRLNSGTLYGLIGPNGAGKTTVFNLLTGLYKPQSGQIRVNGRRVDGRKPYQIVQAGLARTFQNIRLFGGLSVRDNIKLGCQMRRQHGLFPTILQGAGVVATEKFVDERCDELMEVFSLTARRQNKARDLPYGDQRRLEIARALGTEPQVLLLDEPGAGMNPREKLELMELIHLIRDQFRLAILVIEHDMKLIMTISQRITVLDHGETIAVGTPGEIQCNSKVIEAYLGEAPAN
jgi:branched-chain amino acid transport system ATP-binding protein